MISAIWKVEKGEKCRISRLFSRRIARKWGMIIKRTEKAWNSGGFAEV